MWYYALHDLKQLQTHSHRMWGRASSNPILQRKKMRCDYLLVKRLKLNFISQKLHLLISLISFTSLELLASGDLPDSASQSAGMTGMSHCTRPRPLLPNSVWNFRAFWIRAISLWLVFSKICLNTLFQLTEILT